MAAKRNNLRRSAKWIRLLTLAAEGAALIAGLAIWKPPGLLTLSLALTYVLVPALVAGAITLLVYLSFSLAPFSDLRAAALDASAIAMWFVPGMLLIASRRPVAVAAGLAVVICCTHLLASSRAPHGDRMKKRRLHRKPRTLLFRGKPEYRSRDTVAIMVGALALETGVYALASGYPLLAAVCFATVTGLWTTMAVLRGAMEARNPSGVLYAAPGLLLTVLLTVMLTAALMHQELARGSPAETNSARAVTGWLFQRLVHLPPASATPAQVEATASKEVVTRLVGHNGVPGVVLRPQAKRSQTPRLIFAGLPMRLALEHPLEIPFTGEYLIYPASSQSMPEEATVQTGDPLENLFGTESGGPMETVAVQPFEPPIDLTQCGKVLVAVISAEDELVLASLQLVAESGVRDGGADLMGMKRAREETLEFLVPVEAKPWLVHAIRIQFQRAVDRHKSTRVVVKGITLLGRAE